VIYNLSLTGALFKNVHTFVPVTLSAAIARLDLQGVNYKSLWHTIAQDRQDGVPGLLLGLHLDVLGLLLDLLPEITSLLLDLLLDITCLLLNST
jgi:hypothetical protein